jgi:predicted transglutaminase-like cysteine proteinase
MVRPTTIGIRKEAPMRSKTSLLAFFAVLFVAGPAFAQETPFMPVYGVTQPPYGFLRYCDENPVECVGVYTEPIKMRVNLTQPLRDELYAVNYSVNTKIEMGKDIDIYGVSEYWTIPKNGRGDCEDLALMKQSKLIMLGWSPSVLFITVVLDEKKEGHAVLTVHTKQGDFILDNKKNEILLWHDTPYKFVMRQSYLAPRMWVNLDPDALVVGSATAK